ncbi:MAG: hypothetical protein IIV19_05165, partial [Bacteroidaceae bacterium]|nr:hypothetical protein [Bacteroidaceae bacterium]
IEITQSNSWAEKISEGKFLLKSEQTWYRILFTNENFPGLSSDASFQLNKLTGIAAMDVDKLDITIGEKCVLVRGLGDGAEVELISLGGAVLQRAVFMNDEALLEVPDTENVCLLRIRKGNNTQTFKIKVN